MATPRTVEGGLSALWGPRRHMIPQSPIYGLLEVYGTWQPVAALATETGIDYQAAYRSIKRWEAAGLVETRIIELSPPNRRPGEQNCRLDARIVSRPEPVSWRDEAACIGADPDIFFPANPGRGRVAPAAEAKAICAQCVVRDECLDYALDATPVITYGIWGGLTPSERRRIRWRPAPERADIERSAEMCRLRDEGLTYAEIAERYGLTYQAVQARIRRYREAAAPESLATSVRSG